MSSEAELTADERTRWHTRGVRGGALAESEREERITPFRYKGGQKR